MLSYQLLSWQGLPGEKGSRGGLGIGGETVSSCFNGNSCVLLVVFSPAHPWHYFVLVLKGERGSPGGKGPTGPQGQKVGFFSKLKVEVKPEMCGFCNCRYRYCIWMCISQGPEGLTGKRGEVGSVGERVNCGVLSLLTFLLCTGPLTVLAAALSVFFSDVAHFILC